MSAEIDTADHVLHRPTGETWIVARVDGDRLAWVGWPPGWAALSDCELVRRASKAERMDQLESLAVSGHHCADWAATRLAITRAAAEIGRQMQEKRDDIA